MADKYPLIYNPDANQIQELQPGDNLDVGNAGIVNVNGLVVTGIVTATVLNQNVTGVITATSFNGTLTGSVNTSGIVTAVGGFNIGIQSGGTNITTGVITAINFVGTGNSVIYNSSTKTVDVSISGSGGGSGSGTIGIQSGGIRIGTGFTDINVVGTGVTIVGSGTTVTINIPSSGGSIGTTGITTQTFFSNPNIINSNQSLTYPNHNYGMFGPISVNAIITVGAGNTFVVV